jgi:hypothetical protein
MSHLGIVRAIVVVLSGPARSDASDRLDSDRDAQAAHVELVVVDNRY